MNSKTQEFITRTYSAFILISALIILYCYFPPLFLSLIFTGILAIILINEWPTLGGYKKPLLFLTPMYPVLPFILLIFLNHQYYCLLAYIFALTCSFDTGSYLVGVSWGKHTIAQTISPKKTWQGAFGGFITTILVLYLIQLVRDIPLSITTLFSLAFVVSVVAFAGDIFESLLKRNAGIKDTSSLIPGHGGLLDRFDSILFVTIFFFIMREQLATILGCF